MNAPRRHDVHVCLVSDQATPNFIPVLDSRFRPKEVVLVVSPEMRPRAAWLREALAHRVARVSEYAVDDAWDIPGMHERFLELVTARAGEDLALNVTGGTKPMAIAAQEVFRVANLPVFYVHPAKNTVRPLFVDETAFVIEERVRLADYLAIHGFRELGRDRSELALELGEIAGDFIKEVERFGAPLRRLNGLAASARETLRAPLGALAGNEHLLELTDKLERHGVARIEKNVLVFPSEQARFFANGGWLEWHIAQVVAGLERELGIQDIARSLEVRSGHQARNELDVAFLAHNRLFLIECKAKVLAGPEAEGPGAQTLYKLDSLRTLGGLNTRGMLVSYQPLETWDRQRAVDLRIRVVEGGQLRNFARHLREWLEAP